MKQYMHVWFVTLLLFSFSMYSGDRKRAQSFAAEIEKIQVEMNEYSVDHKEMMQQFKSDLEDEYQETRAKLKKAITKAMKSKKIKGDMSHVVGLMIDNMKNEKDPFGGDIEDEIYVLLSSFATMVGKNAKVNVANEQVLALSTLICVKKIFFALNMLLIEKMKVEIA